GRPPSAARPTKERGSRSNGAPRGRPAPPAARSRSGPPDRGCACARAATGRWPCPEATSSTCATFRFSKESRSGTPGAGLAARRRRLRTPTLNLGEVSPKPPLGIRNRLRQEEVHDRHRRETEGARGEFGGGR